MRKFKDKYLAFYYLINCLTEYKTFCVSIFFVFKGKNLFELGFFNLTFKFKLDF